MRIREAARQSGVSAGTIRYYEQLGLLGTIARTDSGYREFDDFHIRLLVFLRKARDLGFSLEECRELLGLVTGPDRRSPAVAARTQRLAAKRLADIDAQIAELERKRELVRLHLDTVDEPDPECPAAGII